MFKFRSWNEKLEKFTYLDWKNNAYYDDSKLSGSKKSSATKFNWKNAEQSTGLFDKNGKETFVGDKVKFYHNCCVGCLIPNGFEGIVKFYNGTIWVDNGEMAYALYDELTEWEIIGNIHEGENKNV